MASQNAVATAKVIEVEEIEYEGLPANAGLAVRPHSTIYSEYTLTRGAGCR